MVGCPSSEYLCCARNIYVEALDANTHSLSSIDLGVYLAEGLTYIYFPCVLVVLWLLGFFLCDFSSSSLSVFSPVLLLTVQSFSS